MDISVLKSIVIKTESAYEGFEESLLSHEKVRKVQLVMKESVRIGCF